MKEVHVHDFEIPICPICSKNTKYARTETLNHTSRGGLKSVKETYYCVACKKSIPVVRVYS